MKDRYNLIDMVCACVNTLEWFCPSLNLSILKLAHLDSQVFGVRGCGGWKNVYKAKRDMTFWE